MSGTRMLENEDMAKLLEKSGLENANDRNLDNLTSDWVTSLYAMGNEGGAHTPFTASINHRLAKLNNNSTGTLQYLVSTQSTNNARCTHWITVELEFVAGKVQQVGVVDSRENETTQEYLVTIVDKLSALNLLAHSKEVVLGNSVISAPFIQPDQASCGYFAFRNLVKLYDQDYSSTGEERAPLFNKFLTATQEQLGNAEFQDSVKADINGTAQVVKKESVKPSAATPEIMNIPTGTLVSEERRQEIAINTHRNVMDDLEKTQQSGHNSSAVNMRVLEQQDTVNKIISELADITALLSAEKNHLTRVAHSNLTSELVNEAKRNIIEKLTILEENLIKVESHFNAVVDWVDYNFTHNPHPNRDAIIATQAHLARESQNILAEMREVQAQVANTTSSDTLVYATIAEETVMVCEANEANPLTQEQMLERIAQSRSEYADMSPQGQLSSGTQGLIHTKLSDKSMTKTGFDVRVKMHQKEIGTAVIREVSNEKKRVVSKLFMDPKQFKGSEPILPMLETAAEIIRNHISASSEKNPVITLNPGTPPMSDGMVKAYMIYANFIGVQLIAPRKFAEFAKKLEAEGPSDKFKAVWKAHHPEDIGKRAKEAAEVRFTTQEPEDKSALPAHAAPSAPPLSRSNSVSSSPSSTFSRSGSSIGSSPSAVSAVSASPSAATSASSNSDENNTDEHTPLLSDNRNTGRGTRR